MPHEGGEGSGGGKGGRVAVAGLTRGSAEVEVGHSALTPPKF